MTDTDEMVRRLRLLTLHKGNVLHKSAVVSMSVGQVNAVVSLLEQQAARIAALDAAYKTQVLGTSAEHKRWLDAEQRIAALEAGLDAAPLETALLTIESHTYPGPIATMAREAIDSYRAALKEPHVENSDK